LHLRPDSALIDAGDPDSPSATPTPPESTTDLDRLPRAADGDGDGVARADVGAFEFQPPTTTTTSSTTTTLPGSTCGSSVDPFARADCALAELLDPGLCAPDAPDAKLEKAIGKRVRKARGATSRAAVAQRHGRLVRLIGRATAQLDKLTRRVTHAAATSDAC